MSSNGAVGRVFRGMLKLALGTGAGRLIGFAVLPLLSRVYSPAEFALLALFTAIVSVVTPIVSLRYSVAIPLPKTDGIAINVLVLSGTIVLIFSFVLSLAFYLFGDTILKSISMEDLIPWFGVIIASITIRALFEIFSMWAARRQSYSLMAGTQVVRSFGSAALKVSFGFSAYRSIGLIGGQVFGEFFALIVLLQRQAVDLFNQMKRVRMRSMLLVAKKYIGFPVWRVPSEFMLVASVQAPLIVLNMHYDTSAIGNLGVALLCISVPTTIISSNISTAQYAESSRLLNKPSELYELSRVVFIRTALISVVPTLVIFVVSPMIVPIALGAEWVQAGTLVAILSLGLPAKMASGAITKTLSALRRNRTFFWFNLSRILLIVPTLFFLPAFGFSIEVTLIAYVVVMSVQQFTQALTVLRILKYNAVGIKKNSNI